MKNLLEEMSSKLQPEQKVQNKCLSKSGCKLFIIKLKMQERWWIVPRKTNASTGAASLDKLEKPCSEKTLEAARQDIWSLYNLVNIRHICTDG